MKNPARRRRFRRVGVEGRLALIPYVGLANIQGARNPRVATPQTGRVYHNSVLDLLLNLDSEDVQSSRIDLRGTR